MPDYLEQLQRVLQETLGIKVPITDAEALASRLPDRRVIVSGLSIDRFPGC